MKILVAYDGSLSSKQALRRGLKKADANKGVLIVLHVFQRSLFMEHELGYLAERLARAESARYIEEARLIIWEAGNGTKSSIVAREGIPIDEVINYAVEEDVDKLLCPVSYKSIIKRLKKVQAEKGKDAVELEILDNTGRINIWTMVGSTEPAAAAYF